MKRRTLPLLGLVFASLLPSSWIQAGEYPATIDLSKNSSLVVRFENSPTLPSLQRIPTALGRSFSSSDSFADSSWLNIYILSDNREAKVERLRTPASRFDGMDIPFSLIDAALSKQTVYYIYQYQNRAYLNAATPDKNGVYRKTSSQPLDKNLLFQTARFKSGKRGLTLMAEDKSGQTQSFRPDPADPLKFKF